ncbi:MAG: OsmC family protein [Candidatus Delongbacteria bacterium]|nr:OsmC family protein [Candidatus Delongbacteria bacterium]MBN2836795.1 OsmC family protein [Candidatus Delongbacteria bacterium]
MSIQIVFPGGKKVDAIIDNHVVKSDQPIMGGGEDSAPSPFAIFLASIGNCAGIYALSFLQQRGIPSEKLKIDLEPFYDHKKGIITKFNMIISVPEEFPEKYENAIIKSVNLCAVKKHLLDEIEFNTIVKKVK